MGAAMTLLILSMIVLCIFSVAYGTMGVLRGIGWVIVGIINFLNHERMMRPKERYYRM